jgi:DNA-directed RNA polymerase subunit RPC12/RpoP
MSAEPQYECSLCGRDLEEAKAPVGCEVCQGGATVQSRAYTLSAVRSGQAPKEDRYGDTGGLAPKESSLVVGGAVNHPGNR